MPRQRAAPLRDRELRLVERDREGHQRGLIERIVFDLLDHLAEDFVGLRLQFVEGLDRFGVARRLRQLGASVGRNDIGLIEVGILGVDPLHPGCLKPRTWDRSRPGGYH